MDNVILIGMPASGKSTAGVLLAKFIGYDFIDVDLIIQRANGAQLCDIIERQGSEKFIEIEQNAILGVTAEKSVIATGGSAVYGERAMAHLKGMGKIIYVKVSYEQIEERLAGKDIFKRGVVMKRKNETLKELFDERAPLYEKYADVTVDCSHLNLEQTVNAIITAAGL